MIVFGPVPSRRLGRSLGINNIPPKACTYSCVYCQVGRTLDMQVARRAFYEQVHQGAIRCTEVALAGIGAASHTLDAVYGRCVGAFDRREEKAHEAIRNIVAGL